MNIGVIGVGTVGTSVVNILKKNKDIISARAGKEIVVKMGVVKNLSKPRNVDIKLSDNVNDILDDESIDLVVELMGGVEEPFIVVKKALANKKAVVSANKALLAYHRYELQSLADGLPLEFEASVAGGIPIITALRDGLVANNIINIKGIMNGTCNYILTRMDSESISYEEILKDAQDLGYAESDPTLDISGEDAAHKLLILASIAYGIDAAPEDILIEGLNGITQDEISFAKEFNYKLKLLAIAKNDGENVELRVHLAYIKHDEMIAKIDGVMNGISVVGDYVGETLYYGAGAGGDATASAIVANIIDIARSQNRSPMLGFKNELKKKFILKEKGDIATKYYIRIHAQDDIGVLSIITSVFSKSNISIEKILQKPIESTQNVNILLSTHICNEFDLKNAIKDIKTNSFILDDPYFIRIEET
jgi:homoserine dehydrogenase